jgi:hypothetical protein
MRERVEFQRHSYSDSTERVVTVQEVSLATIPTKGTKLYRLFGKTSGKTFPRLTIYSIKTPDQEFCGHCVNKRTELDQIFASHITKTRHAIYF